MVQDILLKMGHKIILRINYLLSILKSLERLYMQGYGMEI